MSFFLLTANSRLFVAELAVLIAARVRKPGIAPTAAVARWARHALFEPQLVREICRFAEEPLTVIGPVVGHLDHAVFEDEGHHLCVGGTEGIAIHRGRTGRFLRLLQTQGAVRGMCWDAQRKLLVYTTKEHVGARSLDGTFAQTFSHQLIHPTAVTVHPQTGEIYVLHDRVPNTNVVVFANNWQGSIVKTFTFGGCGRLNEETGCQLCMMPTQLAAADSSSTNPSVLACCLVSKTWSGRLPAIAFRNPHGAGPRDMVVLPVVDVQATTHMTIGGFQSRVKHSPAVAQLPNGAGLLVCSRLQNPDQNYVTELEHYDADGRWVQSVPIAKGHFLTSRIHSVYDVMCVHPTSGYLLYMGGLRSSFTVFPPSLWNKPK